VTFGMALFSYVAIRDAAGEGALYGSISPYLDANNNHVRDTTETTVNMQAICNRVAAASTSPVDMSSWAAGGCTSDGNPGHALTAGQGHIDVVLTPSGALPCEGTTSGNANAVQVRVEYAFPIMMPYIGGIIGTDNIHLTATVTDTVLTPRCP
jgi:hypothetical protein